MKHIPLSTEAIAAACIAVALLGGVGLTLSSGAGSQRYTEPARLTADPGPEESYTSEQKAYRFVVRFHDDGEIEEILKLYRKDKAAARDAFAEWSGQHAELSGMVLYRASYSGEAILVYEVSRTESMRAKDIAERLNSLSCIRYADPDYTAHAG